MVDIVCLDFSVAFDTVSHSIPLDKLSSCEISSYEVCCVKNWLNGMARRVVHEIRIILTYLTEKITCYYNKESKLLYAQYILYSCSPKTTLDREL